MPYRIKQMLDYGRSQQDAIAERLSKQGNTLSAWLVLGNAGALSITIKPILDGAACATLLRPVALAFAIGLLLTVAGMAIGYVVGLWSNFQLGKILEEIQGAWIAESYIDELEKDGIEVKQNAPLRQTVDRHDENMARMQKPFARQALIGLSAAFTLTSLGSISFAAGVITPLIKFDRIFQCQAVASTMDPLLTKKSGET